MAKRRPTKKTKKKSTKKPLLSVGLIIFAVALYMSLVWFFVTQSYQSQPLQSGHLASGEAFTGDDYSKSLDLSIAARSKYPSSAIKIYRNLGDSGQINTQEISFSAATDNLTEYGLMTTPDGQPPAAGWPIIILCHGYYNPDQYRTTVGYIADMDFYSEHGYAVIKPDFRGQGLSIHQGSPEGAYYSMAYNTDVMSLISAVKQTPNLNSSNINLWGHSMGAYIALRAADMAPEVKNVILLSGPVGYPKDLYSDYLAPSDFDNPVAYKLRQVELLKYGTPTSNTKFWNTTAPINYVGRLKANVEINVGTDDLVVPPLFSAELDSALQKAHKVHEYYVYPGGNHGLDDERGLIWARSLRALNGDDSIAGQ